MIKKISTTIFAFLLIFTATLFAQTTYIYQGSETTYATSDHNNGWDDTYVGKIGLRGADAVLDGDKKNSFMNPTFIKITYNVQGDIYSKELRTNARNGTYKIATITVKDKWNFGTETKVYAKCTGVPLASGASLYTINSENK